MDRLKQLDAFPRADAGGSGDRPPNVILIVTDQQRADFLGCYGHPVLLTPHIDSLAAAGARFERCYVASPVCMPNRASIVTGRMPSSHRVRMNGIPLSMRENTFVDLLRLRGYHTALVGKSHLQNMIDLPPYVARTREARAWTPPDSAIEAVRRGADEDYGQELPERWRGDAPLAMNLPFYGFEQVKLCTGHGDMVGGHYYQWLRDAGVDPEALRGPQHQLAHRLDCPQAWRTAVPEEQYPTRYIENESVSFIREHARTDAAKPFFLMMAFPDPHHPFTPPGRYWDLYAAADQPLPASFGCPDDVLPQVRWAREQRRAAPPGEHSYSAFAVTESEARTAAALTCGMLTMIDDAVGRVLATLRECNLQEDTIVIFTSDHGDFLGDHGLLLKGPLHLQSLIRVPLVWFDPRAQRAGIEVDSLASSIDIAATILDRAGIEPYNGLQGRSLLPALHGEQPLRDTVLIQEDAQEAHFGFRTAPRIRTLITDRYRLTLYGRSGHGELFDLREDPHELANRWQSPDHARIRCALMEELTLAEMEAADTSPWPVFLA